MPREWTKPQKCAIETRGKTLLVCAAAGSGKTATLTERIIRSLTDRENPADICDMLIVTFTRAAASELRQKIYAAISDALSLSPADRHLNEQLIKLGSAKICTIDSFYLDVIRTNFAILGLPPSFRMADAEEMEILEKSIMTDTVNFFYDSGKEDFPLLNECLTNIKSSENITDILLDLYSNVSAYPQEVSFLRTAAYKTEAEADLDFFDTTFGRIQRERISEKIQHFIGFYEKAVEYILSDDAISDAYAGSFSGELDFCRAFLETLENGGYEAAKEKIYQFSPEKLKSLKAGNKTEKSEILKNTRSSVTKELKALAGKSFGLTSASIAVSMHKTASLTKLLWELLSEFDKRFSAEKLSRAVCDFQDLKKYTLKLFVDENGNPTETALMYSEKFTDIYIDEYQDVDRVQDMIFSAIAARGSRFMVGDIKQSIYSFRGAEPQVFATYKRDFPHMGDKVIGDCATVFMSDNFRCDENIIRFTNAVCSPLFSACSESIGYTEADNLKFSKAKPSEDYISPKVNVAVITPNEKSEDDGGEESDTDDKEAYEARYIAAEISRLLRSGRKADGSRILPEDIAVLFRSKKYGVFVGEALSAAGIPYSETDAVKYFESPDVLLSLCLLNVIDNPQRDIYLAGLLRSPLFSFTMDDLILLRSSAEKSFSLYDALTSYREQYNDTLAEKCNDFVKYLDEMRDMASSMPVDRLLRYVFASDLFAASGLFNSDESSDLLRLYEYARKFEAGAFRGLYNFIEYINRIIEENKSIGGISGNTGGCVSLMTIHHSKGLEFPVCFICGCGGKFNKTDYADSLLFEASVGVAMKIADGSGFARVNTPMREAILSVFARKQIEEEMRVLYVALTRAREKLYITASSSRNREKLESWASLNSEFCDGYTLLGCSAFIEWILLALGQSADTDFCTLDYIPRDCLAATVSYSLKTDTAHTENDGYKTVNSDVEYEYLKKAFAFRYPYLALTSLPAKISVSALSPSDMAENGYDAVPLIAEENEYQPPEILRGVRTHESSPSERGTATHLFLQFCDFSKAINDGVHAELARLIEKKYIPDDSTGKIYIDELEAFFQSDFFEKLKSSRRIVREQRFNILLPPSCISDNAGFLAVANDEMLAVQGVIDLVFEDFDGHIYLADYKTDRISRYEASHIDALTKKMQDRHAEQLSYYAVAVERLFGKKCDRIYVYSTCAGKCVEITPKKII